MADIRIDQPKPASPELPLEKVDVVYHGLNPFWAQAPWPDAVEEIYLAALS